MPGSEWAATTIGRPRIRWVRLVCVVVLVVAGATVLGARLLGTSPGPASLTSTAASTIRALRIEHNGLLGEHRGRLGEADGAVPGDTTVFDDDVPGVTKLDPALLGALRRAATDAGHDGVRLVVDSGWRSAAYQAQLLREAIAKYGSAAEAARWVARPDRSEHVAGHAVDLAPAAAAWLSEHGAAYGLCQIYDNERWHFELRADAVAHGCPPRYADASQDPRLQR